MPRAQYASIFVPRVATAARSVHVNPIAWALTTLAAPPAIAALYLVKSALGINLLPGPSPLHGLLYHLVA